MNKSKVWIMIIFLTLSVATFQMHDQITVYQQMIIDCEKEVKVDKCYLVALAE